MTYEITINHGLLVSDAENFNDLITIYEEYITLLSQLEDEGAQLDLSNIDEGVAIIYTDNLDLVERFGFESVAIEESEYEKVDD